MKRLALLGLLALGGCSQQSAAWFVATSPDIATALHRHRVEKDLRAIRAAQARPRVRVVRRSQHNTGRRLGISLAAKAEGGLDVSAERARFRALGPDEQEACLASYTRHAPKSEAGRAVLEALWDDRD